MTSPHPVEEQSLLLAEKQFKEILALQACPAWYSYFRERLRGKLEDQQAKILEGRIKEGEYPKEQAIYQTLQDILTLTERDLADCRRVLAEGTMAKVGG